MRKQIVSIIAASVLSILACSSATACQDQAGAAEKEQKKERQKERQMSEHPKKTKDGQQVAKKSDNKDGSGERLKCRPPKDGE